MEQAPAGESQGQDYSTRAPEAMRFTGTGAEYFGIWIVNLLLTIVTVGIYSSWAKVRRLQYFYRHTELAGSSFDFHVDAAPDNVGAVGLEAASAFDFDISL
jgi:uncharacterized membrane protein YjgN (DUF898 family)